MCSIALSSQHKNSRLKTMAPISRGPGRIVFSVLVFFCALQWSQAQVLTPPYFNLAQSRRIVASATCGEDVSEPELFCKLVGANAEEDNFFIQGQVSRLGLSKGNRRSLRAFCRILPLFCSNLNNFTRNLPKLTDC